MQKEVWMKETRDLVQARAVNDRMGLFCLAARNEDTHLVRFHVTASNWVY